MNYLRSSLVLSFLLFMPMSYAKNYLDNQPSDFNQTDHSQSKHWYLDLGAGWVLKQSVRESYMPRDPIPDRYTATHVQDKGLASVGLGYMWSYNRLWLPYISMDLAYSALFPSKITGYIQELSFPQFSTYRYQYRLDHNALSLNSKLEIYRWKNCMPYVSLGLGSVWNKSSDYEEVGLGQHVRISPRFSDKTKTEFLYTIGAGLDFILNQTMWLNVGYRYDNFHNNETGNGRRTFLKKHISSRSHAGSFVVGLRYLFA